jgi:NAD-dependent DNA ligase
MKLIEISNFFTGDEVEIIRGGEVIPKITRNLSAEKRIRDGTIKMCLTCNNYKNEFCYKYNIKVKPNNKCEED